MPKRPALPAWSILTTIALVLLAWAAVGAAADPAKDAPKEPAKEAPKEPPITTAGGPVGDLLKKWWAEGTAAGNLGDWYDNRDRGHSGLDMGPYPQLKKVAYSEQDLKVRADWAAFVGVRPFVTFGNSSTSAGIDGGGSNSRSLMSHPRGLDALYTQYARNNVYMYPEHCDYRPGHNGTPNHGDVYPTNTPYLITSQGSSGSDQPFMRAIPFTLAAFRPDVKRKLIETGLVMPTLQMIFRMSNKPVAGRKQEYLTGKAHPPVFDGSWVDDKRMVEMAHDIEIGTIPPLVQLEAVEEDGAVAGHDFFDAFPTEKLGDTPCVIARIYRSRAAQRRIVVSAEKSRDVNQRPLTFQWVVLQGDSKRIRITPKNKDGSVAEIVVPWHERFPVPDRPGMETNRVDIGVFVNNGATTSAPGFVTFFCLDCEARTWDDKGRILEIGYGLGTTDLRAQNWPKLFDLLKAEAASADAQILKTCFKEPAIAALLQAADEYRPLRAKEDEARATEKAAADAVNQDSEKVKQAEAKVKAAKESAAKTPDDDKAKEAVKQAETELADAQAAHKKLETDLGGPRKAREDAERAAAEVLAKKRDRLQESVKDRVEGALRALAADPGFYPANQKRIGELLQADAGKKPALANAWKRLVEQNLLKDPSPDGPFVLVPLRGGGPENLTRYERALVEQFNDELLQRIVLAGLVSCDWRRNYVDPRISLAKSWRDVYHYDAQGHALGWTRYDGGKTTGFSDAGGVIVEKDSRGRCTKARTVRYAMDVGDKQHPRLGPLTWTPGDEVATVEYAGDDDWTGRIASHDVVPAEKK